jgi:hypothetical protein
MSKRGVDTLLTSQGKLIQTGEEIRFVLVKGPNYPAAPDPVNPKAPTEQFPQVAKFAESVVTPNIQKEPWKSARLYQQDVPKVQEDSDEEVETKDKPKKRWRRRKDAPKRQWILQNQVEFLESMMAKRQRKQLPKDQVSTRYEGVPEHNPSQYILLEQQSLQSNNIQVTMLPTPNATVSFSQPKARKTLSMAEAEIAIQDQRGKMTRFMMHDKQRMLQGKQPSQNESRKRLFGRLTSRKRAPGGGDEEEEEDIMGDVAFRNRKGSGRARKELLTTLGDSALKVDQDGVLGGNNDREFGKGQRFNRFNADNAKEEGDKGPQDNEAPAESSTKGNDGHGMADNFYQRDVGAEYEELDYDANEQFDDDDVDVGETEVMADGSGFAADDEDEEDLDDDNPEGEGDAGPQGLANLAMFRLLLAKARGEITNEQVTEAAEGNKKKEEDAEARRWAADSFAAAKNGDDQDHLSQIMSAAERSREAGQEKGVQDDDTKAGATPTVAVPPTAANAGVQVDENGQRLITLENVRREIWLHHGTISTKRLMKIFDTKKKKDRQAKFREVVKELCTMETDPVQGRMFVLKQHYSNMG